MAPSVADRLQDSSFEVRLAAIQALSDMQACSEAGSLAALAHDTSKAIRLPAVNALAKLGESGAAEVLQFLADDDYAVRSAAVRVFSPLHSKLPSDIACRYSAAVVPSLHDEDHGGFG